MKNNHHYQVKYKVKLIIASYFALYSGWYDPSQFRTSTKGNFFAIRCFGSQVSVWMSFEQAQDFIESPEDYTIPKVLIKQILYSQRSTKEWSEFKIKMDSYIKGIKDETTIKSIQN